MSLEGKADNEALAEELFSLQENENFGRGISCVVQIADCLRRDDIDGARAIAWNENDKIRSFPVAQEWLEVISSDQKWIRR